MNWLAHLRLSPPEPLVRLGNLLGDFLHGVDVATLPEAVQRGVRMHRALDAFTDAHPAFRRSRERIRPPFRRFSGVLVDVFYDHFLARGWAGFGDGRPLGAFTAEVYADLQRHAAWLPGRLREVGPRMAAQDWLGGYAEVEHVDTALSRMADRLRRPTVLGEGGRELRAHDADLAADFAAFWPDVVRAAGAIGMMRIP